MHHSYLSHSLGCQEETWTFDIVTRDCRARDLIDRHYSTSPLAAAKLVP